MNRTLALLTTLMIALPIAPLAAQQVTVPVQSEVTVIHPARPPVTQEVTERVDVLDLVVQSNQSGYQRSEFVERRRLLRLSQNGL